jgi:CDP-diacylglycerol--serine O-phosphatidyltransferase
VSPAGRDLPARRGIPLRAIVPNAVTALALCTGLTGIRFAIAGEWTYAVYAVVAAGVLDGLDGRIARALKGQSKFGAELDSLSDVIAFGVSPAIILHLWSLQHWPRIGWLFALSYAVCLILWIASNREWDFLQDYRLVAPWAALIAFLAISSLATFSWGSLRLRRHVRFEAIVVIALLGGALITAPFETLSVVAILYIAMIPVSVLAYGRVRRRRAASASSPRGPQPPPA